MGIATMQLLDYNGPAWLECGRKPEGLLNLPSSHTFALPYGSQGGLSAVSISLRVLGEILCICPQDMEEKVLLKYREKAGVGQEPGEREPKNTRPHSRTVF